MKTSQSHRQKRRGFTLLEILVVIAIIVILGGLGVASFGYAQNKQREEKTKVQLKEMESGLSNFKLDNGYYPGDGSVADTVWSGAANGGPNSSVVLFEALSGDWNSDGLPDDDQKIYVEGIRTNGSRSGYVISATRQILDGWKNPFLYEARASASNKNNPDFDLWSIGKEPNTPQDDITNWK